MSELLGIYRGEGIFAGTDLELTRANGKGFTALRLRGPGATEARDLVCALARQVVWQQRAARDAVLGFEVMTGQHATCRWRRRPHVTEAAVDDYADGTRSIRVYGRLRQTRDVIERGLEVYASHLAAQYPGTPVPLIRFTPSASP